MEMMQSYAKKILLPASRFISIITALVVICPLYLAGTAKKAGAESNLNTTSSRLQMLNLRLKESSRLTITHNTETEQTGPEKGNDSAEVRVSLADNLKAFICLKEDGTADLPSGDNQKFRAILGFAIEL